MSKFVIDIDGVIADNFNGLDYNDAMPIKEHINCFNELYDQGHIIIYFTARGYETGIDWYRLTTSQLMVWGAKYHDVVFGKPSADYYIDDKAVNIKDIYNIKEIKETHYERF